MSNSNSSVSWRLNGLLRAREKAKAFAATSWTNPDEAGGTSSFAKWQPKVLSESGVAEEFISAPEPNQQVDAEQEILDQAQAETQAQAEDQARQEAESLSEAALEQAKREAFEEGYQRGLDEGESQFARAKDGFAELTESLRAAQQDMTSFYDPLKKLALHLAEQLVRGELSQSSAVIERLITEALKDVEQQGEGPVILYLNPMDKEKFSVNLDGELQNIDLRADPKLSQGSVRVSIDDSAIEDLLEHRLDSLAQSLLGQPMASTGSAFENNFANPVDEKIIEGAVEVEGTVDMEDQIAPPEPIDQASSDPSDTDSPELGKIESPELEDEEPPELKDEGPTELKDEGPTELKDEGPTELTDEGSTELKHEKPPKPTDQELSKPTDDQNSEELNSDD